MKKHVIFDIDGTLLDSEESVLLSLQETVLMKKGKHMETEELKFALGIPSEAALRRLGFAEEELAETVQFWGTLTPSYHKYMRIFPGIRETLTALKEKGIRLGIVTSRNRPVPAAHVSFVTKFSTPPWSLRRMTLVSCPPTSTMVRASGER